MKIINFLQKKVGKITNKHCSNCKFIYKENKCTRLDKIGYLCRKGIYPIGYINK